MNKFFDNEEKEIDSLIEKGDVKAYSASKKKELKQLLSQAAKNTNSKRKVVNLRISERDLFNLKAAAFEEGLSYQTYISSILHKFINKKLT